jgi:hypothetical protein
VIITVTDNEHVTRAAYDRYLTGESYTILVQRLTRAIAPLTCIGAGGGACLLSRTGY